MPSEQELVRAVWLLQNGGLVALPTETVYGLSANALDVAAVQRIYDVKGRPKTSPLIVHVASIEMARSLAREWPLEANILAGAFWPGPLTMVVKKRPVVPDLVTAGLDTVGLRMPAHPVMLEVIRRAQVPLAAPSANRFTEVSPTTAQHVYDSLGDAVDLILDGGPCRVGIESTVVSLAGEEPVLLRPGMISREDLERLLERPVRTVGDVEGAHPSPGLHHKHYSPRTPAVRVSDGKLPAGRVAYVWWRTPADAAVAIRMPDDVAGYARELYGALLEADRAGVDVIAVEATPTAAEWAAIEDRLRRALQ
ncbi:MAG: threonylcarbamoyl-AMP synthase [Bryobacterales bacterium]|nr:threonylcarbamoyl-AMP synthase [Bryobacterales bacterium]